MISGGEEMMDSPYGEHTVQWECWVFTFDHGPLPDSKKKPISLTTFSTWNPKEEILVAIAINQIYTPILNQQILINIDFSFEWNP